MDALRAEAAAVWNANYCDDGAVTSILASSLWLNDKISFKQASMDALAKYYYASSFRGEMGSAAFDKTLQDWIDQQTGGLLKEQASGLTMDKETILALASTIYFRAKWSGEFSEANTVPDTFHADSGDTTCDFMASARDEHLLLERPLLRSFQAAGGQRRHVVPAAGRGRYAGGTAG